MSIILKNRSLIPGFMSNMLDTGRFLRPDIFDFDGDLFDFKSVSVMPEVNITESDKEYIIEMAAPGLEKKDFKVTFKDDVLTISSEKKEERKEEEKNFMRREFSYSAFSRSFNLPENSLPDKLDAKYENGVLRLMLPKKEVTVSKAAKEIKVS
jgi:HSP20 family protein